MQRLLWQGRAVARGADGWQLLRVSGGRRVGGFQKEAGPPWGGWRATDTKIAGWCPRAVQELFGPEAARLFSVHYW